MSHIVILSAALVGNFRDNEGMDPKPAPSPASPTPEDYYFDGEFLVFTAAYHLKRGFCCGSGCRHCPYGFSSTDEAVPSPGRPCPSD